MAEPQQQEFQFKELEKFGMYTNAPGESMKRAALVWSSYRGNPRISVFTRVTNDTNKGIIQAPMSPEVFMILMDSLETAIRADNGFKTCLKNFTTPKAPEGSTERPDPTVRIHLSDTYVGKDENGILWISVIAENRPKIKFEFRISDFHKLIHGNGTPFTDAEASALQARAWIKGVSAAMATQFSTLRDPLPRDENGQIKRSGGYNRNNNQQRNTNSAPAKSTNVEFEDLSY